jgi:hypothetical protein
LNINGACSTQTICQAIENAHLAQSPRERQTDSHYFEFVFVIAIVTILLACALPAPQAKALNTP